MIKVKRCNLCGSGLFSQLYYSQDMLHSISGKFKVVRCQNCSLTFLDPKLSSQELRKYYPRNYYAHESPSSPVFFTKARRYLINRHYSQDLFSKFLSLLIKVPGIPSLEKKGKIMDMGCGNGETLDIFQKLGWEVYGVEFDDQAVKLARKRGLRDVVLGSFERLKDYPDNFFDVIRLYHVIEHLGDPSLCLKLCQRKLKTEGELIIGTPNFEGVLRVIFGKYWYNLDSPRHLYIFSPKTLKKMIINSRLKLRKMKFASSGGLVGSLQHFLNRKFNKKLGLINKPWLVVLFFPLEWIIDRIGFGDVFVLTGTK